MIRIFGKFVIGVMKGSTGIDIDEWIDNMPKASGELLGKAIAGHFDDQEGLSDEGIARVEQALQDSPEIAEDAFSAMIATSLAMDSFSILESYASLMNMVLEAVRHSGRPVVTKGFLHSADCLTYWSSESDLISLKDVQISDNRIWIPTQTYVCVLKEPCSEFEALNLSIRKNGSLSGNFYGASSRVQRIYEFKFGTNALDPYDAEIEIPIGAPGAAEMISSLLVALEHQRTPEKAMQATMATIASGFSGSSEASDQ